MPDDNGAGAATGTSDQDLRKLLDSIFNASNWRERVEREMRDVFRVRRKNERLRAELDQAKDELEKAKPKDGSVVMSKADNDELIAYRALGKLKELQDAAKELTTLRGKDAERTAEEQYTEACELLGWENKAAVTRFLKREGLHLEFKDLREKDPDNPGKFLTTRLPVVRPKADDKADLVPLDEYVQTEVPEYEQIFAEAPVSEDEEGEEGGEVLLPGTTTELTGDTVGGIRRPTLTRQSSRRQRMAGVPIAGTRGARPDTTPTTRDKKTLERMEEEARASGQYRF